MHEEGEAAGVGLGGDAADFASALDLLEQVLHFLSETESAPILLVLRENVDYPEDELAPPVYTLVVSGEALLLDTAAELNGLLGEWLLWEEVLLRNSDLALCLARLMDAHKHGVVHYIERGEEVGVLLDLVLNNESVGLADVNRLSFIEEVQILQCDAEVSAIRMRAYG